MLKERIKQTISFILALTMAITFAGCDKKDTKKGKDTISINLEKAWKFDTNDGFMAVQYVKCGEKGHYINLKNGDKIVYNPLYAPKTDEEIHNCDCDRNTKVYTYVEPLGYFSSYLTKEQIRAIKTGKITQEELNAIIDEVCPEGQTLLTVDAKQLKLKR